MARKIIYVDNFLTGHGHTPTTGISLVRLFRQEGYTVIQTSNKQNQGLRLADMLFTIAANRRNAVVLLATYSTTAFYFAFSCSLLCRFFRVPYIPCLHGGNLPVRIKRSSKMSARLFSNSFINVAVSDYLHKSMIDQGWRSVVIPNNINLEAYEFRRRAHCSPSILWVRSFHRIYNPELAIRVLKELLATYPEAELTMVGPDKDGSLKQCKALVKNLGVEKQVKFTGLLPRDEWVKIARNCDIFINTTNFDNLPVSVVEAMALGLISINTEVGGIPYLVQNEQNGLLVPAGDQNAFVQAIQRVLKDKQLSEQLSIAARVKAEQFDWNVISKSWSRLFNSIPPK